MSDEGGVLDLFHPHVRGWFEDRVGEPTEIQRLAWPKIAAGEHVLVTAPTGSGKTLTAFLWALDRLLAGVWPPGEVRVLYVSPLRALNTDIRRNLERPLAELTARWREAGGDVPGVRAMTRSGDTPPDERRKMMRRPPEILITTPESLNILLTSQGGRKILTGLATVILDEVHAVAATKRGTHLVTAVERLVPLSGEFQRIALSATVRPLEGVAELVGGYEMTETEGEPVYRRRTVKVVRSVVEKRYDVRVRSPQQEAKAEENLSAPSDDDPRWARLASDWKRAIRKNRGTLFFANSRRMTERVTRLVNQGEDEELAYSHHGSLSREVRAVVEQRLKDGELPAIVATNSLELGIDVGSLDEVVMIQTPRAISSAIQRVGRAGHGVGEVSRGRLYPTFGRDFLNAAVVARAIYEQDIEELRPIQAPLDVLAQVVLSMVAAEDWDVERLYASLRTSVPYRHLHRRQFDLVLEMLAGRYADTRIRELKSRITFDRVTGTVRARRGVARLLYMAGGTIPDRGYFSLRHEGSMAKIGELDEEFVWERSLGDSFTLGAQSWQIRRITHNDVVVVPGRGGTGMPPFWRADAQDRDFHFSQKVALFLTRAEERLEDPAFFTELAESYSMEPSAAAELLDFLKLQKAATGVLPHRWRVLVEHVTPPAEERGERRRLILHTFWGGKVNRPLAMALAAAWEERYGERIEIVQDDDCILLMLPRPVSADDVFSLVEPGHVEELLRARLERTGFFGSRFRWSASTSLLLPRAGFRQRTPLWLNRRRSKKLMESVMAYGDFPILVETWRTCLKDDLDLDSLKQLLGEVREEKIALHEVRTDSPSPFTSEIGWQLTNQYMYEDDTPEGTRRSGLRPDLLQELVFSSHLRPRLPADLVERFRRKVQRTAPGYAPRDAGELLAWIDERVLIPVGEWRELLLRVTEETQLDEAELLAALEERVVHVVLPGSEESSVAALDRLVRVVVPAFELDAVKLAALGDPGAPPPEAAKRALEALVALPATSPLDPPQGTGVERDEESDPLAEVVAEWLRFQGPVRPERLAGLFGLDTPALTSVLQTLDESRRVVLDELTKSSRCLEVCDAENLEVLLRWLRVEKRPSFEALPADYLPLFLAHHQGLLAPGEGPDDLKDSLEKLFGYPAPAPAWEAEYLPARLAPYYPSWIDSLMQESDLMWLGCGPARLLFAFPLDLELFLADDEGDSAVAELFPHGRGRFALGELAEQTGKSTAVLTEELWRLAWEGRVTNDTFLAVRKGIESKWKPSELPLQAARRSRRAARGRWQASRPFHGNWLAIESAAAPRDALDAEERNKDRVRQLLQRYGVLFRELLARELPSHQWGRVFRTLRIMELGGEVLTGRFFEGIRGLQFISQAAFRELRRGLPEDAVYWLNATDPASLCGVDVEGLRGTLPARQATTHLVFHGRRLVVVSKRRGRELDVRVAADHPLLGSYLDVLKVLLTREVQPLKSVDVEVLNDEAAATSPYALAFEETFRAVREQKSLKLWKRY